jgi:L-ribulose-5-phosphate 4-epimerase
MILKTLREEVLEANLELVRRGLVLYTFGNASGIDRKEGLVVIKPSGVPYESMKPEDLVVVDLNGKTVEGNLRPSSDLATHLILYKAFEGIGGVAHTHSRFATAWAQAAREIPCFGTTHADYFHGPIPVTRTLTPKQIRDDYEVNTGNAIVRRFAKLNPLHMPGVLVAGHAPFCWGASAKESAHAAVIVEEIAAMATATVSANPKAKAISKHLHDKHFLRKHGASAYYGQKK